MVRIRPLFSLSIVLGLAAAAAACSVSQGPGTGDQTAADTSDGGAPEAPIATTINPQIVATLADAGLTVDNLPADLDAVKNDPNHAKLHAVMKTFTIALGTTCGGCHAATDAGVDFGADTPRKNVARRMWSDFVAQLAKKDGTAIYCDTCHQGQVEFLDRSNSHALSTWMKTNFVGSLKRRDGSGQECMSCHGDPFNGSFLDDWERDPTAADAGAAPDAAQP